MRLPAKVPPKTLAPGAPPIIIRHPPVLFFTPPLSDIAIVLLSDTISYSSYTKLLSLSYPNDWLLSFMLRQLIINLFIDQTYNASFQHEPLSYKIGLQDQVYHINIPYTSRPCGLNCEVES